MYSLFLQMFCDSVIKSLTVFTLNGTTIQSLPSNHLKGPRKIENYDLIPTQNLQSTEKQ